jgi:hypothetical protein
MTDNPRSTPRDYVGLRDEAARIFFMFEDMSQLTPEGLGLIRSPEPWRAVGRFFDEHYGGSINARKALGLSPWEGHPDA